MSTMPTKKAPKKVIENKPKVQPALEKFFVGEIKDIYWAEKHLVKTLPKMHKAASSEKLRKALEDHLKVTKEHVVRLEKVFELLDEKVQAKKCEAMAGITKEGEEIIEETEEGTATRDVGIILASQKVEHYEISTYGGLAQLADTLGLKDIGELLAKTLAQEKEADSLLSQIAKKDINYDAAAESEK
jgi:ferritin-like metal-binding protein YciE